MYIYVFTRRACASRQLCLFTLCAPPHGRPSSPQPASPGKRGLRAYNVRIRQVGRVILIPLSLVFLPILPVLPLLHNSPSRPRVQHFFFPLSYPVSESLPPPTHAHPHTRRSLSPRFRFSLARMPLFSRTLTAVILRDTARRLYTYAPRNSRLSRDQYPPARPSDHTHTHVTLLLPL